MSLQLQLLWSTGARYLFSAKELKWSTQKDQSRELHPASSSLDRYFSKIWCKVNEGVVTRASGFTFFPGVLFLSGTISVLWFVAQPLKNCTNIIAGAVNTGTGKGMFQAGFAVRQLIVKLNPGHLTNTSGYLKNITKLARRKISHISDLWNKALVGTPQTDSPCSDTSQTLFLLSGLWGIICTTACSCQRCRDSSNLVVAISSRTVPRHLYIQGKLSLEDTMLLCADYCFGMTWWPH